MRRFVYTLALIQVSCSWGRGTFVSPLDQADSIEQSAQRTSILGRVYWDCAFPTPAVGVTIELVQRPDDQVVTTATTNDNGEFILRSPYLPDSSVSLYVRWGEYRMNLPGDADQNYRASLAAPCREAAEPTAK